jgi:ArsR family transcriptional regulator
MPRAAALRLAQQFKVAADPVRLRILSFILSHAQERACVCTINDDANAVFHLPASAVARHLRALRQAGLLDAHQHDTRLVYQATAEGQELLSRLTRTPAHA